MLSSAKFTNQQIISHDITSRWSPHTHSKRGDDHSATRKINMNKKWTFFKRPTQAGNIWTSHRLRWSAFENFPKSTNNKHAAGPFIVLLYRWVDERLNDVWKFEDVGFGNIQHSVNFNGSMSSIATSWLTSNFFRIMEMFQAYKIAMNQKKLLFGNR